jgi:transaldolase/glucose-6-phosphate isomerase
MTKNTQLNSFVYKVSKNLEIAIAATLAQWKKSSKTSAEWNHESSLWTNSGEEKWLGWLDVPANELKKADELQRFADEVRKDGFQHVVLLGMGGSSLCAEVFAKTFAASGSKTGYLDLHILDSTDPVQIKTLEDSLPLKQTLFIVSSKSGSTLEPNIFFEYFYGRVKQSVGDQEVGHHFIAITDPGTSLEKIAVDSHFRKVFYGVPSIGGRYSVLSDFGMVPAALMGVDIKKFLSQTLPMVEACAKTLTQIESPGVLLGILLGEAAKQGRDKITFFCAKEIVDLGAWLEQLLAESTGKQGKGLIPIDRETIESPDSYGADRVFIYLSVETAIDPEFDFKVQSLEKAGHPVVRIKIKDRYHLGQEFFRWEMATSVAGAVLGINPFDQPDVEASKVVTRKLTQAFEENGSLPDESPIFENEDLQIFDDLINETDLKKDLHGSPTVSGYLRAHLNRAKAGDYFAILAYVPMNAHDVEILQDVRGKIMKSKKVATCVEFGPRFLHSTGQAYKGGPNSGVFLQITSREGIDINIPGHTYSFGVVKAAEARGDFEVLTSRNRRAMRIHLRKNPAQGLEILRNEIEKALK